MKILVTGFSPFASHDTNPSEEVLVALDHIQDVKTLVLPVIWEKAEKGLLKAIEEYKPDFILSLGYSPFRNEATLEQYAYNEMNSPQPDEEGVIMSGEVIIEGGPRSLSSNVDLLRLQQILEYNGVSTSISGDPGRFVCNMVYYLDLNSNIPSLFVHLPPYHCQSLDEQKESVVGIVNEIKEIYSSSW